MARPRATKSPDPPAAPRLAQRDDPEQGSWGALAQPDGTVTFYQFDPEAQEWRPVARRAVPHLLVAELLVELAGPRPVDASGFWVPREGDVVTRPVQSWLGEAYMDGVVVASPSGKLRVRMGSATTLLGSVGAGGKLTDLTPAWRVRDDPAFERRAAAKEAAERAEKAAEATATAMALDAVRAQVAKGSLPVTTENLARGLIQPGGRLTSYTGHSGYRLDHAQNKMVVQGPPSVTQEVSFVTRVFEERGELVLLAQGALPDASGPDPDDGEFTTGNARAWQFMAYDPPPGGKKPRRVPLLPDWERIAPDSFLDLDTYNVDPNATVYALRTPVSGSSRFVIFPTRAGTWYGWHLDHTRLWALTGTPASPHRTADVGRGYPTPQAVRAVLVEDLNLRPWSRKQVIGERERLARRASLRDDPRHAQAEPEPDYDEVWEFPPRGQKQVW